MIVLSERDRSPVTVLVNVAANLLEPPPIRNHTTTFGLSSCSVSTKKKTPCLNGAKQAVMTVPLDDSKQDSLPTYLSLMMARAGPRTNSG